LDLGQPRSSAGEPPDIRSLGAYFDFEKMDAEEAVVFWLGAFSQSIAIGPPRGGNANASIWGYRSPLGGIAFCEFEQRNLVDRDGDNWREYVFECWGPDYGDKVFRFGGERIVAWDTAPDEATGSRKGYTLDKWGELRCFEVTEKVP